MAFCTLNVTKRNADINTRWFIWSWNAFARVFVQKQCINCVTGHNVWSLSKYQSHNFHISIGRFHNYLGHRVEKKIVNLRDFHKYYFSWLTQVKDRSQQNSASAVRRRRLGKRGISLGHFFIVGQRQRTAQLIASDRVKEDRNLRTILNHPSSKDLID